MKEEVIPLAALRALPEYSCSLPTGVTVGKRWRRRIPYESTNPDWIIGEYYDIGSETDVGIRWSWAVSEPGTVHRGELR